MSRGVRERAGTTETAAQHHDDSVEVADAAGGCATVAALHDTAASAAPRSERGRTGPRPDAARAWPSPFAGRVRGWLVSALIGSALTAAGSTGLAQTDPSYTESVRRQCYRAIDTSESQRVQCARSCIAVAKQIQESATNAWWLEIGLHVAGFIASAALVIYLIHRLVYKDRRAEGFKSGWALRFNADVTLHSVLAILAVHGAIIALTLALATPHLRRADWFQRELLKQRMHESASTSESPTLTCHDIFGEGVEPAHARDFAREYVGELSNLKSYTGMYAAVSLPSGELSAQRFDAQYTDEWRQRLPQVVVDLEKVVRMAPSPYLAATLPSLAADDPNMFELLSRNESLRAEAFSWPRLHFFLLAGWRWQWLVSMAAAYFVGFLYQRVWLPLKPSPRA